MHSVLVTGGDGQLGRAIAMLSEGSTAAYIFTTHKELDICNQEQVEEYLTGHNIDVVINCAAYTDVEGAEADEESALRVNRDGVATIAKACQSHNARLIHISTDYVFGGDSERRIPYSEDDKASPINSYGRSKAQGEIEAIEHNAIVIRTAWLYSPWCKNFARTIVRLAKERTEIEVVDDQCGTPTSALSLAQRVVEIIDGELYNDMSGIYHYTDKGEATWHEFATEIVTQAGITTCKVSPCKSADRAMKASRPAYSVLSNTKIEKLGITRNTWQEELQRVMTLLNR
jgi:dTDP-4-dehydrorhamnose reductase